MKRIKNILMIVLHLLFIWFPLMVATIRETERAWYNLDMKWQTKHEYREWLESLKQYK